MDSRQFIDLLGAGESSDAKGALEELISSTAFEALNSRKQEIASTLFGGNQSEPEVQEEANEVTPEQGKKMMDSNEIEKFAREKYYLKKENDCNKRNIIVPDEHAA